MHVFTISAPINGYWSDWSAWGPCNQNGFTIKRRTCNAPQYGGMDCEGHKAVKKRCHPKGIFHLPLHIPIPNTEFKIYTYLALIFSALSVPDKSESIKAHRTQTIYKVIFSCFQRREV